MRRLLLLSALLGLASGGFSCAQTFPGDASAATPTTAVSAPSATGGPSINVVPALPGGSGSEPQDSLLPAPRLSSTGGVTRAVLDLPRGASYTLSPTFTGLRIDLRGVSAQDATERQPTGELSAWAVATDPTGGVVLTLTTPFPLGLGSGWRAFELPAVSGEGRRLVMELGATLEGGAAEDLQARVLSVAPATATPPGDPESADQPVSSTALAPPQHPSPPPAAATPAAPTVTGLPLGVPRIGKNAGYTRVVLDLPRGATYAATPGPGGLSLALRGVTAPAGAGRGNTQELLSWRAVPVAGGVTLTLATPFPLGLNWGWRSQLLSPAAGSDRPRLVLDFSPAYADLTPLPEERRALTPIAPDTLRRAALPVGTVAASPALPAPVRVVLDPGHGGSDPGAIGAVTEKEITLDVALRVRDLLQAAGAEVVMTRASDMELNPSKDVDLRMRGQMGSPPAALFVSIHVNSMEKNAILRGYGVETWWYGNNAGSQSLANHLQQDVVALTGNFSRGLQTGRSLSVLRNARVPAALVEIGFTSHPVDGQNLRDDNYLDRVAMGIAQGIRDTLMDQ